MALSKSLRIACGIIILSIIVIIHEAGHFASCKLFNIHVPVFSIGFGPALVSYKVNETTFQIAMLPLGGYVAMNVQQLQQAPYWQKIMITLSGVFNNFILALLLLLLLFLLNRKHFKPIIARVARGSPAEETGLASGDRIVRIQDELINNKTSKLLAIIQNNPDTNVHLVIDRDGNLHDYTVHLQNRMFFGGVVGYLGITFAKSDQHKRSFFQTITSTGKTFLLMIRRSLHFLIGMFSPRKQPSKPLRIDYLMQQNLQKQLNFFLFFVAIINIELGIFNLLPIPMLDGGQAVYYTIEAIIGHALSNDEIWIIHFIYLLLIIALLFYLNRKSRQPLPHDEESHK